MTFYGREYHVHSCDAFTRAHLESEGVEQRDGDENDEDSAVPPAVPRDEYTERRAAADAAVASFRGKERSRGAAGGGAAAAAERNKMRKYLDYDGKVLR